MLAYRDEARSACNRCAAVTGRYALTGRNWALLQWSQAWRRSDNTHLSIRTFAPRGHKSAKQMLTCVSFWPRGARKSVDPDDGCHPPECEDEGARPVHLHGFGLAGYQRREHQARQELNTEPVRRSNEWQNRFWYAGPSYTQLRDQGRRDHAPKLTGARGDSLASPLSISFRTLTQGVHGFNCLQKQRGHVECVGNPYILKNQDDQMTKQVRTGSLILMKFSPIYKCWHGSGS